MSVRHIDVLGGGPAGIAVGLHARRLAIPFTIHEAGVRAGGNAVTFEHVVPGHGAFRFDSGAHRFHDADPRITELVSELMGPALQRVDAPSRIRSRGAWFDFPLSPLDLLVGLGPVEAVRAAIDLLVARLERRAGPPASFEEHALRTYGRTIAERFLLEYSSKLWGSPCDELSVAVAGSRLEGLDLRTFVVEAILGARAKTRHLDGSFFYPVGGFGAIVEALARACGDDAIRLGQPIARIEHDGRRVRRVAVEGGEPFEVDQVVSTLPIGRLLSMLDPAPPEAIARVTEGLRYRFLVLVALFLDKPSITDAATVYFPEGRVPFTRVSEPRNRWVGMAPAGKTSLIVEIPCQPSDAVWSRPEDALIEEVVRELAGIGWFDPSEVIGHTVRRLPFAYPILERGYEARLVPVFDFLGGLENLRLAGRSGRFAYVHVHDLLREGRALVSSYPRPFT